LLAVWTTTTAATGVLRVSLHDEVTLERDIVIMNGRTALYGWRRKGWDDDITI